MSGVAVRDEGRFDGLWIEPQLLERGQKNGFDVARVAGVDHDNAVGCGDRVGDGGGAAHGINVVEQLDWFNHGRVGVRDDRSFAKEVRLRSPFLASDLLGFRDVRGGGW